MRTRLASPAAVIAVVLLAWACDGAAGSESDTAASSRRSANVDAKPTVDVCSLVTAEEIAAATGATIAATEPSAYGPSQVCNYQQQGQPLPVVSLLLTPSIHQFASSTEMAEWQTKRAKSGMSMGNIKFTSEPVEGLGVPAIKNEIEGAGMITVVAAAKGRLVEVTTSSLEWSKALVPKAIARLP